MKLITFLNDWGKISPLRLEGQFTTRVIKGFNDLNTSLVRWKYDKHNPLTQNTSLK
jgi:hypothetical protein